MDWWLLFKNVINMNRARTICIKYMNYNECYKKKKDTDRQYRQSKSWTNIKLVHASQLTYIVILNGRGWSFSSAF